MVHGGSSDKSGPVLTVAIPTFQRLEFLSKTLEAVLSQATGSVEILVSDNHSLDGTWEFLGRLPGAVRRFRQEANVGLDLNTLNCIESAQGKFVWLLGDDDLPCANTVAAILAAIDEYPAAPLIFLRSEWQDSLVSRYSSAPVAYQWSKVGRDQLLLDVGIYVTVLSSIVVRRDAVDWPFVRKQVGSLLVPAAIVLSTIGASNQGLVSDKPLVVCRGGNSGGYDGLAVFTRNLRRLLEECRQFGFSKRSTDRVYVDGLSRIVPYLLRDWPWNLRGLVSLFSSSYGYAKFYSRVLPVLVRAVARKHFGRPRRAGQAAG